MNKMYVWLMHQAQHFLHIYWFSWKPHWLSYTRVFGSPILHHQIENRCRKCILGHQSTTLLEHLCVWGKSSQLLLIQEFCFPCLVLQISAPRMCLAPPIYGCYVSPWWWPSWKVKGDPFLCHLRGQFRPTVCELYPRHPITKDSCILKASEDPWRTERAWCSLKKKKKKRLRWKTNKEDLLLFLFCFVFWFSTRPVLQKTPFDAGLWRTPRAQRRVGSLDRQDSS